MQEFRSGPFEREETIYREFTEATGQNRREMRRAIGCARGQTLIRQVFIGRNDPCPCESGLKFKKCCIEKVGRYDSL